MKRILTLAAVLVCGTARAQLPVPCTCGTDWGSYSIKARVYAGAGWIFAWTNKMTITCEKQSGATPQGNCTYQLVATVRIWSPSGWIPVSFTDGGSSVWTQNASVACNGSATKLFGGGNHYCPDPNTNPYQFGCSLYSTTDGEDEEIWSFPPETLQ